MRTLQTHIILWSSDHSHYKRCPHYKASLTWVSFVDDRIYQPPGNVALAGPIIAPCFDSGHVLRPCFSLSQARNGSEDVLYTSKAGHSARIWLGKVHTPQRLSRTLLFLCSCVSRSSVSSAISAPPSLHSVIFSLSRRRERSLLWLKEMIVRNVHILILPQARGDPIFYFFLYQSNLAR